MTRQHVGTYGVYLSESLKSPDQNANVNIVMRFLPTKKVSNDSVPTVSERQHRPLKCACNPYMMRVDPGSADVLLLG